MTVYSQLINDKGKQLLCMLFKATHSNYFKSQTEQACQYWFAPAQH